LSDVSHDEHQDEYPHQQALAAHSMPARAVYRELERADDLLDLDALSDRLRTPRTTVRRGANDLVDDGLANKWADLDDRRKALYALDVRPSWAAAEEEGQR
jgi:DNA-binding MarR family transcriptional regulator